MGLLDALRMAVPGVAAARTGYLQGQEQSADKARATERQSMVDRLKQALDESTIAENNARADYYRNGGAGGDAVQYIKGDDGEYYAMPKKFARRGASGTGGGTQPSGMVPNANAGGRAGDAEEGASGAAPPEMPSIGVRTGVRAPPAKAPAGPRVSRPNVVNPASGMIEDIFSDGSRREVRKATPEELAKATHVPTSTTGGAGGTRPMTPRVKEQYFQSVADNAIRAAGGDVQKAEYNFALTPEGQKAFGMGLNSTHFAAAKQRFDRQYKIDSDVHLNMDTTSTDTTAATRGGGALDTLRAAVGAPPPNYRGAPSAGGGKPGNINLAPASAPTPQDSKGAGRPMTDPQVEKALRGLRSGAITIEQLDGSKILTAEQKAAIRRQYRPGGRTD